MLKTCRVVSKQHPSPIMSKIFDHFRFNNAEDTAWTLGSLIGICILILASFTFIRIMQFLCRTPYSDNIKSYSKSSATFAVLALISIYSVYPLCAELDCHYTALKFTLAFFFWDFYFLSKFFLYLMFIDRLFNPNYRGIYQYSKYHKYVLWMLLIVLVLLIITFNIYDGMIIGRIIEFPVYLDIGCGIAYAITDSIMATYSMILFLGPICSNGFASTVSLDADRMILKQYAIASVLQLFAAVSFDVMILSINILTINQVPMTVLVTFWDINHIIQMCDCLLLMICIYIGFARTRSVCYMVHLNEIDIHWNT